MDMRFRHLGVVLVFCLAAAAQTQTLTLDQLLKFLSSSVDLKMSDSEVAKFLVKTRLSEKLDDVTIEKLLAGGIGPKTLNALRTLRDQSESLSTAKPAPPPKKVELPPIPNSEEQAAIIDEVREYALNYSKSLPNFLSTQVVRRYQAGRRAAAITANARTFVGAGGPADAALELLRPEGRLQADSAQQQPDHAGL